MRVFLVAALGAAVKARSAVSSDEAAGIRAELAKPRSVLLAVRLALRRSPVKFARCPCRDPPGLESQGGLANPKI